MDHGLMRQEGLLTLAEGHVLRLRDAAGRHLTVVHGTVWITQLGDRRDPVLTRGECLRFERDGLSLVQALGGPAVLLLEAGLVPEGQAAGVESAAARARRFTDSESFRRDVKQMRSEAVAAAFVDAVSLLRSGMQTLWSWLRGLARASARADTLRGLSDHQLRDLGLRRERVRFGFLSRICGYC